MTGSIRSFLVLASHHLPMARWYRYEVRWANGVPPFVKNLRVANARLHKADWEAPLLTEDGFVGRWRSPLITAKDVYRILYESNAQPGAVLRWECTCDDWFDCDAGLADCGYRRAYKGEDERNDRCNWFDENYAKFYEFNDHTRILKSKRNVAKCPANPQRLRSSYRPPYKKNPRSSCLPKRR